jgi:fumarate hydratase class II
MPNVRQESDSLGVVEVPADRLWGAQTQRSLEHFSIGTDLIPREMITAYAILKKGAAAANLAGGRLDAPRYELIAQVCDEILAGQHHDMFPLRVWMTGSSPERRWAARRRCIPTITSTWRSRRTTRFRRPCTSPPPSTRRGG